MPLFDAYLFVDWSASNGVLPERPRADSPWIGERLRSSNRQVETYHRTRREAVEHLGELLRWHVRCGRRVLVGFDFALGYPAGLVRALGWRRDDSPWQQIWHELAERTCEQEGNRSNRFEVAAQLNELCGGDCPGPFWARPDSVAQEAIPPRSPGFPFVSRNGVSLARRRTTELHLPRTQETWKLAGIGAVGSQTLLGIPLVHRLRQDPVLGPVCRVFPYETGFTQQLTGSSGPAIVCTEIYMGVVSQATAQAMGRDQSLVRDRAQVRSQCQWVSRLDRAGELGGWFAEPVGLTEAERHAALTEEGWILGAR
jgi:hypothetical protein